MDEKNLGLCERLELEFDFDIVDDFMTHFGIFVDNLEPVIVSLADTSKYTGAINELFRMFHTMKSACGFLSISQLVNICRIAEDVLDDARKLSGPASDELIDWLLLLADQFGVYKKDYYENAQHLSLLDPKIIKIPTNLNN